VDASNVTLMQLVTANGTYTLVCTLVCEFQGFEVSLFIGFIRFSKYLDFKIMRLRGFKNFEVLGFR
jgi:hypothetical protein